MPSRTSQTIPSKSFSHPNGLSIVSPNISTNRALIRSSSAESCERRAARMFCILSRTATISCCESMDTSGRSSEARTSILMPLIVAPRAWDFRYDSFAWMNLHKNSLLHNDSSIPTREMMS